MTIELKGCILVPEGWRRGTLRFSQRIKAVLGAPVAAPAAVPTLGEWSLLVLGAAAAALGMRGMRRRPSAGA